MVDRRRLARPLLGIVALSGLAAPLAGQADCFPARSSNEARLLAIKSVALAYGPGHARTDLALGRARLALESAWVPRVDDATATPTVCRPGKGPENANLLDVLVRPRLTLGLPGDLSLEASWVPPVRVAGVRAHLVGIALARATPLSAAATATVRLHATFGRIRAPITCPDEALADPSSECFEGTRSDDRYDPNIVGADLALSLGGRDAAVRPYVGAGYNRLQPRFQVNFTNRQGSTDTRRVSVDLDRAAVFGGLTWTAGGGVAVTGEVYAAPADAVTGRVLLSATLGR
jgi:hypothetical protein